MLGSLHFLLKQTTAVIEIFQIKLSFIDIKMLAYSIFFFHFAMKSKEIWE